MAKRKFPFISKAFFTIIPLIVIYSIFNNKIIKLFGPKISNRIFIGLIVLLVLFFLYDFLLLFFSGFSDPFFGSGKKAKKILRTGKSAIATVLNIGENSGGGVVTINDQPYFNLKLKINSENEKPYEINFDTIIPRHSVSKFQPGAIFPVKIDPSDSKNVVIDTDVLQNNFFVNFRK